MSDDFTAEILKAHKRSFKRAFETAVRTGTALVFMKNGKVVEVKPPYRYKLVSNSINSRHYFGHLFPPSFALALDNSIQVAVALRALLGRKICTK